MKMEVKIAPYKVMQEKIGSLRQKGKPLQGWTTLVCVRCECCFLVFALLVFDVQG